MQQWGGVRGWGLMPPLILNTNKAPHASRGLVPLLSIFMPPLQKEIGRILCRYKKKINKREAEGEGEIRRRGKNALDLFIFFSAARRKH